MNMERVVNLTPHVVTVYDTSCCEYNSQCRSYRGGSNPVVVATYQPEGVVARCTQSENSLGVWDNVPVVGVQYGVVENLPDEQDGVKYVVSALVANAARKHGRKDLLTPARLVRDDNGNVVGCLAFAAE